MSEENKAVELKEEELEKVCGGGVEDLDDDDDIVSQSYRTGDAFILKQDPVFGTVLKRTTAITPATNLLETVPCIRIMKGGAGWIKLCSENILVGNLRSIYQYSAELTAELSGKIF